MSPQDSVLEERIEAVYRSGIDASNPKQKQLCFQRMAELIAQRSPERITAMEIERGLR